MDVLVLIDKLDELVHNAKAVPLTDQVRIDREEIWEILDQMRATIPEEIKQARWIVKERQEMLGEAKREAERIVMEAREIAQREASQQEVVRLAERQAQQILDAAKQREREIRLGAEDYADEILSTLEVNLGKFLSAVQRGREQLSSALAGSPAGERAVHGDHDRVGARHVRPPQPAARGRRGAPRARITVRVDPFTVGHETYTPSAEELPAELRITRLRSGLLFELRFERDAARPVPPLPRGRRGRRSRSTPRSTRTTIRSPAPRTT